jgi:hypothetical protein
VPAAGERRVGVVVEHDAVLAPQEHDWHGRAQEEADGGLQALRPGGDRAQGRGCPVVGGDERACLAAGGEESKIG